jgi:hypothetical protein
MQPCLFCGGDPSEADHLLHCDGRQGLVEELVELAALGAEVDDQHDIRGMVHRDDGFTALESAHVIARRRSELHELVLQAFAEAGPMTDEELERLPQFRTFGPSTLRKRRSELYEMRALEIVGDKRNSRGRSMFIWAIHNGNGNH